MSVYYPIYNTSDNHWQTFIRECKRLVKDKNINIGINPEYFITIYDDELKRFNGRLIIDEHNIEKWIDGIEFKTEQDLLIFKLTFN